MAMGVTIQQLLKTLVDQGGTDLHITTNSPPQIRIDGKLVPLQLPPLTAAETKQLIYSVLTDQLKNRPRGDDGARVLVRPEGNLGPEPIEIRTRGERRRIMRESHLEYLDVSEKRRGSRIYVDLAR